MENASKALIIAGAILLSIIIISLGIMVVNNARNQMGGANLNKEQVQTFNSQWEAYVGDNKSAAEVKALYSLLISHNSTEESSGDKRFVTLNYNATTPSTAAATAKPSTYAGNNLITGAKTYKVLAGYDTKTGLIVGISIKPN